MFKKVVSFIRELYPGKEIIPLHEPCFAGKEKRYLEECIDSTFVSSVGKFVDAFERVVEEYTGTTKAVVTVNGTEALHLALILLGIGEGDEVITQPLTFVATVNAIAYTRAVPVFVDVDRANMGLSPDSLNRFLMENAEIRNQQCINLKTGRRIKACIPVHAFGHPCRIDEIVKLCETWHIDVIEDAAESIGSIYKGRHTGTFGKIGVLSFNGNKTITTGGGGMLLLKDEYLGKIAKHLSTQAKVDHQWKYYHDQTGYNFRMPNLNAALGLAQMEQIDRILYAKRYLATRYSDFFQNNGFAVVNEPENAISNYWLNTILLENRFERDSFLEFTNEHGIRTRPVWTLINKLPMYEKTQVFDLSNSEWLEDRIVNLPSSVYEI